MQCLIEEKKTSESIWMKKIKRKSGLCERTFAHAAPILWNKCPDSLRSVYSMEDFKSALKPTCLTYLHDIINLYSASS